MDVIKEKIVILNRVLVLTMKIELDMMSY